MQNKKVLHLLQLHGEIKLDGERGGLCRGIVDGDKKSDREVMKRMIPSKY